METACVSFGVTFHKPGPLYKTSGTHPLLGTRAQKLWSLRSPTWLLPSLSVIQPLRQSDGHTSENTLPHVCRFPVYL